MTTHRMLSTANLDYLQRSRLYPTPVTATTLLTFAPPPLRRLYTIHGVGRLEKAIKPEQESREVQQLIRLPSEDIMIGLYGYKIPLAFLVQAEPKGVTVQLGTWSAAKRENASSEALDARQQIVNTVLTSLYPAVDLTPANADVELSAWPLAGLVLGVPTTKRPDPLDGALQLDRLIRSLTGARWAYLVLAEPIDEGTTSNIRDSVITELRSVQSEAESTRAPSPLGQYYSELLQAFLKSLTQGQAIGLWRTALYLLGDATSYYRLASACRGIFSGDQSLPEPIRIWDSNDAAKLAARWAMTDSAGAPGPGSYQHPFQQQTLLTSSQLATYVHLPQLETSGFSVTITPDFDTMPPVIKASSSFSLGNVLHQTHSTQMDYLVSPKTLTRHTFVAGVTGAGKTNTIFYLLKQIAALGTPFLVIEPAKTEYRALLNHPDLADKLRIFTLGDEQTSPFRLNPFEVLPGTPVSVHLDLLRSVFTASFGMWTPLPQILEQSLHRIYVARGWNLTMNRNPRVDNGRYVADAFPTLSDLVATVDEVTLALGYEERITADMRAALHTRLNSLRVGGKGHMLDVQRSWPMKALLDYPTILELEGMGDDDDKAFLMGLLLIRLAEYRRAAGEAEDLQHVLVIEEAHRLLANVGRRSHEEEADPRGKAVETFSSLLSEIRAYGQGVIVADQIPTKLAPDVIKNTHLKIAHRVVAYDDREVLAGAMAMDERQQRALSVLTLGQAALFSEGDDAPVLVQVPLAKGSPGQTLPDDQRVAEHMVGIRTQQGYQPLLLPFPSCATTCAQPGQACEAARGLIEHTAFQRTFARTILSTMGDTNALDRMWADLLSVIRPNCPPKIDEEEFQRCVIVRASHWFANRRGAQIGWSYAETEGFAVKLEQMLLAKLTNASPEPVRSAFQQYALRLHPRQYNPFPACDRICQQQPPACLYRYAVADLVATGIYRAYWRTADANDARTQTTRPPGSQRRETWEVCQDASYELIEFPEEEWAQPLRGTVSEAAQRVCLCFAQQMLAEDTRKSPRTVRRVLDRILMEAKS